jgi:nicotinamidase-related amidase
MTDDQRLTPENAAVVLLDHQTGIMMGVGDMPIEQLRNNAMALSKVAKIYGLPTILATSYHDGPNGPLWSALTDLLPDAPVIHRPGQINA